MTAKPKTGDAYTFNGVYNETDDRYEPLGNGVEAIQSGTRVTVRELVPADVAGAHDDSEDSVVVETAEGRAWSVGADTFASDYTPEG